MLPLVYVHGPVVGDVAWPVDVLNAFSNDSHLRHKFESHLKQIMRSKVGCEFRGDTSASNSMQKLRQPPSRINVDAIGVVLAEFIWPPPTSGIAPWSYNAWLVQQLGALACWTRATVIFVGRDQEMRSVLLHIQNHAHLVNHRRAFLQDVELHYVPQQFRGKPLDMKGGGAKAVVMAPVDDSDWRPACLGSGAMHIPTIVLEGCQARCRTLQIGAWTLESTLAIVRFLQSWSQNGTRPVCGAQEKKS